MVRVLLLVLLMAATAVAQDAGAPGAPGAPGQPRVVTIADAAPEASTWRLDGDLGEAWFDRDGQWEAIDPRALAGRDAEASRVRYFHNSAGVEFAQGAVTATFEPAAMGPDDRLSLFICSQVPASRQARVTGYEVTLDRAGALRILRLDGDDAPVLLASSTAAAAAIDASASYVLAVARTGAGITAQVRAAGADEPVGRVSASDDRYRSGRVGVALPEGAGRVAAVAIVPAVDVGPLQQGKPAF
jgi:hypothetical protein